MNNDDSYGAFDSMMSRQGADAAVLRFWTDGFFEELSSKIFHITWINIYAKLKTVEAKSIFWKYFDKMYDNFPKFIDAFNGKNWGDHDSDLVLVFFRKVFSYAKTFDDYLKIIGYQHSISFPSSCDKARIKSETDTICHAMMFRLAQSPEELAYFLDKGFRSEWDVFGKMVALMVQDASVDAAEVSV